MIRHSFEAEAVFYRIIAPVFAARPLSGMGAARQGGRFNRPGTEALYLSSDEATALAEYRQDNPWLPPGTICTFFVNAMTVADLRKGYDRRHWPPVWADYDVDWRGEWFNKGHEPPTWYMADDVLAAGLDGLLFPSLARAGGVNLVIFDSSMKPPAQLRVYDPDGQLARIALPAGT